jgi:hypothetical protein
MLVGRRIPHNNPLFSTLPKIDLYVSRYRQSVRSQYRYSYQSRKSVGSAPDPPQSCRLFYIRTGTYESVLKIGLLVVRETEPDFSFLVASVHHLFFVVAMIT